MSIWIRVVCRSSVADITPEALRVGIAERLLHLASVYGVDGAEETQALLQVEQAGDKGKKGSPAGDSEFHAYQLRWREDQAKPVRIERWVDDRAEEEVGELRDWLEDYMAAEEDDEGCDEIARALDGAEETVALELKSSDTEGMGWPVLMSAAHFLAVRGDGIIRADGEGWLAPEGDKLRHVLEAD